MANCPKCDTKLDIDLQFDVAACKGCGCIFDVTSWEEIGSLVCQDSEPSFLLPFEISEDEARKIFLDEINKIESPDPEFVDSHPEDKLRKIYAPTYVFTSVSTLAFGGFGLVKENKRIMEHAFEAIVTMKLKDVPFICSDQVRNYMAQRVEPFDFSKAESVPSDIKYDKPEAESKTLAMRFFRRIKEISNGIIKQDKLGYTEINYLNSDSLYAPSDMEVKLALLPVYVTEYGDEQYAINGQTGKFEGKIPLEPAYQQKLDKELTRENAMALFYHMSTIIIIILIGITFVTLSLSLTMIFISKVSDTPLPEKISLTTMAPAFRLGQYASARFYASVISLAYLFCAFPIMGRVVRLATKLIFPKPAPEPEEDLLRYLDPTTKLSVQRDEKLGYVKDDPEYSFRRKFFRWFWPDMPD